MRWTGDASDADLYQYLALTWGDPKKDPVTASAGARFAEDLDGERNVNGFHPFDSLDDSYRRGSTGRLYTAYVDFHRPLPGLRVRAGRQFLDEMPEALPLDGALARFEVSPSFSAAGFAGRPVNLFESSPSGDLMYGGALEAHPWRDGRLRFEYLHLKDENAFGLFKDDLFGLSVDQSLGAASVHARYTALEGESRDLTARAAASFPEADLLLQARVNYLFKTQQAFSYPLDPYSLFLLELEPYVQFDVRASKNFGAHFGLDGSVTVRELSEDGDEAPYNHEFVRWNLTPRADGWPIEGISMAVPVDFWDSSRDDFWTVGWDLLWRAHPRLALGAGTSYALYTVDAFTGEERERVRALYGTVRFKLAEGSTLDVRLSLEENDLDTFRTLEVGVRHAF